MKVGSCAEFLPASGIEWSPAKAKAKIAQPFISPVFLLQLRILHTSRPIINSALRTEALFASLRIWLFWISERKRENASVGRHIVVVAG